MKKSVGKRKRLGDDEKRQAVLDYHRNGNASAIAQKYGVARSTLLGWIPTFSTITTGSAEMTQACVNAIEATSDAVVRSIDTATATRTQFLQENYAQVNALIQELLKSMKEDLKKTDLSLGTKTMAFTALINFIKDFTPAEEGAAVNINLLQQTVNRNSS